MSFDIIIPFLSPIESLLLNQNISEIMVNPDSSVWIEEEGKIQPQPDIRFASGALFTGLEVIANRFGKKLNADSPVLNLRLPDGSRMAAIIPPVVMPEPLLTIRKFTSRNFTIHDLIDRQMLTPRQADILTEAVRQGDNLLISGGTGTGKTTLLNVLADAIPEDQRILIIEDTAELHLRKPHLISMEAQLDTHKKEIGFSELLRATLRHRPDRIIVGEIRGPEARVLLDALNTGHRGTLSTIHATNAHGALLRLAQLAVRANAGNIPVSDVEAECAESIDLVVQVVKVGGMRRISEMRSTDNKR